MHQTDHSQPSSNESREVVDSIK